MNERPLNLWDYERLAREKLPQPTFDYYAGGAADEITLGSNRAAFERIRLCPRVLVDVSQRDCGTSLLGDKLAFPLVVAPLALSGMAHPEGEAAVARAAQSAGIPYTLSTFATTSIEEVAAVSSGPLWFQLYVYRNRDITRRLIERAENAGYRALVVTVDAPLAGRRERDIRNRLQLPANLRLRNFDEFQLGAVTANADDSAIAAYAAEQIDPAFQWHDVDWLCSVTSLPVVLKGILRADDALKAVEHGAAGVIVSNHGGRQLDTTPAAIEVLPEISTAVRQRVPILMDGGVRRGTDMVKALALGASAVLLGRPVLWGLAAAGEDGVRDVLRLLRDEFDYALALCGCPDVQAVSADLIFRERKDW